MTEQTFDRNPAVLAVSAFAVGVAVGFVLNDAAKRMLERARVGRWHRDYEQTEEYGDENLPEPLGRREPAPEQGLPRYGGTGALGVHPAAATAERSANDETPSR